MSEVAVSVLVPVLNEEAHLRAAAERMLAQELEGEAEFLFIDGGSDDGSLAILGDLERQDRRVRVLHNPYRRTPQALNIGLRAARGEFIARMDAHTLYPPRYLQAGIERLRRGGVESVSGPQLAEGRDAWSRRVALALRTSLGTGGARFRRALNEEIEVDTGFTGLWRRDTLERLGGWSEEWVNDQDVELAARLRKAGGRIVCIPEMAARYIPRNSLRGLARQYATYGTFRVKTARRHPESMRRSQILPPLMTATLAASLVGPGPLRRPARAAASGYAAVLGVTAVRAAADGAGPEAAWLPVVFVTMHLAYGAGFIRGCLRFGTPTSALIGLLGWTKATPRSDR